MLQTHNRSSALSTFISFLCHSKKWQQLAITRWGFLFSFSFELMIIINNEHPFQFKNTSWVSFLHCTFKYTKHFLSNITCGLYFIFSFKFLLEYSCFTMCQFLLQSKMNPLYMQLPPFQISFPFRSPRYIKQSSCAVQDVPLVFHFIHSINSVYVLIPSQTSSPLVSPDLLSTPVSLSPTSFLSLEWEKSILSHKMTQGKWLQAPCLQSSTWRTHSLSSFPLCHPWLLLAYLYTDSLHDFKIKLPISRHMQTV